MDTYNITMETTRNKEKSNRPRRRLVDDVQERVGKVWMRQAGCRKMEEY